MGVLAAEIKAREAAGKTLIRQRTDDGFIWREVDDWNKRIPQSKGEQPDPFTFTYEEDLPEYSGPLDKRTLKAAGKLTDLDTDCCVVVARCAPSASRLGLKEPRVVVMGKRWDAERVKSHPLVMRLRLATLDSWLAGLALIRVHTGTPTVRETAPFGFLPDVAERVRPPGDPVFL